MYGKVEYDELLDAFKCEICGNFYGGLAHHIHLAHKITADEYRRRFGLNKSTPLVTSSELEKHRERCRRLKIFDKMDPSKLSRYKKGDNTRQKYERSEETKKFLRTAFAEAGRRRIRANRILKNRLTNQTKSAKIDNN